MLSKRADELFGFYSCVFGPCLLSLAHDERLWPAGKSEAHCASKFCHLPQQVKLAESKSQTRASERTSHDKSLLRWPKTAGAGNNLSLSLSANDFDPLDVTLERMRKLDQSISKLFMHK